MRFFTPWLTGAIIVQGSLIVVYVAYLRHVDPVGWGFALVANAVVMMGANVGTEIVRAIESRQS